MQNLWQTKVTKFIKIYEMLRNYKQDICIKQLKVNQHGIIKNSKHHKNVISKLLFGKAKIFV